MSEFPIIKKNVFETSLKSVVAHGGQGKIQFARLFNSEEFQSPWHFVDYAIISPGSSIGEHRHGANEEMYFILEGRAIMRINDRDYEVKPGDLILNRSGWKHGLRNESSTDVKILVVEVGIFQE
jgi:glyoxylate utilization-related uncharacterized protein